MTSKLYYGDNLQVLREHVKDESVDLIYLDPPFNSAANYNVLFRAKSGEQSQAQIEAFEDTWHWNDSAALAFDEVINSHNTDAAHMLRAMRSFLGENDMMAYLAMMAARLLELHRVLKPTGSIYLHCDPTASHYLKIMLDAIFGAKMFRNEISWKRSSAHSDAKQGMKRCGKIRDILLFYTKEDEYTWNQIFTPYDESYLETEYRHKTADGRHYKESDATAAKPGGDVEYPWRVKRRTGGTERWQADLENEWQQPVTGFEYAEVRPYNGRYWAYSKANMVAFAKAGELIHRETGMPRVMQFADKMRGIVLQDSWDDIQIASGKENLGYPTQKPVALLERIIAASSNEGDVVLDPFCGCGTTVHAAEKLKRQWIGIDVTHLAISLIERRMKDAFPGINLEVEGTPKDLAGARDLASRDKYQFQWWITSLIGAIPAGGKKKGMDRGIDGYLNFRDGDGEPQHAIVSVKGGETVSAPMIRDLKGTIEREKAAIGIFLCLGEPTREMVKEASAHGFYETGGKKFPRIQMLTAEELFAGKRPQVPFGFTEGFKAAPREKDSKQGKLL